MKLFNVNGFAPEHTKRYKVCMLYSHKSSNFICDSFFFPKEVANMCFQLGCNKKQAKDKGTHLNVRRKEIRRTSRLT